MAQDPHINNDSFTVTIYTVATLPAAATQEGERLWVSDATVNPLVGAGSTAAGGGTTRCKVQSNGSIWKIAA